MKISDILRFFGLLPQKEIFYIGGSDVLPMPLKGAQEQEALEALERGRRGGEGAAGGAQSAAGGVYCPAV